MPPTSITTLPPEIIHCFQNSLAPNDQLNLALTNHQLSNIALPYLHHLAATGVARPVSKHFLHGCPEPLLFWAIRQQRPDLVRLMGSLNVDFNTGIISHGKASKSCGPRPSSSDISSAYGPSDWYTLSLRLAVALGHTPTVQAILESGPPLPDPQHPRAHLLLYEAVDRRHTSLVAYLLSLGIPATAKGANDVPLLVRAAQTSPPRSSPSEPHPILPLLISSGADVNAPDFQGRTPLHAAVSDAANLPNLKFLLYHGADPDRKSTGNTTPLMVAVRTFEAQNLVNALCDAGANLDLVNDHDMTALHSVICMLASVESEHQIKSNEALAVTLLNAGARCDVGARFDDRGWEKLRKRGVIGRSLNTRVRGRRRVQPQVGKDANSGEQSVVELKGVEKVVVDTRSKKQRRRDKKKEEEQRNKNGAEESESRTKPRTGRTRSTPQPQHNAVIGIRMRTTRAGSERAESRQGVGCNRMELAVDHDDDPDEHVE